MTEELLNVVCSWQRFAHIDTISTFCCKTEAMGTSTKKIAWHASTMVQQRVDRLMLKRYFLNGMAVVMFAGVIRVVAMEF